MSRIKETLALLSLMGVTASAYEMNHVQDFKQDLFKNNLRCAQLDLTYDQVMQRGQSLWDSAASFDEIQSNSEKSAILNCYKNVSSEINEAGLSVPGWRDVVDRSVLLISLVSLVFSTAPMALGYYEGFQGRRQLKISNN